MPFHKFLLIPTFIGILAFGVGLLDQNLAKVLMPTGNLGFAFITFQAWAVYFFAGCNVKGGAKAYVNYLTGIVAAITIILIAQSTGPSIGIFAMPLGLCVGCIIFLSLERISLFNLMPPMFISAGMFFGLMTYMPGASFLNVGMAIAIYALLGLVLGWITIVFRTWYEGRYAAEHGLSGSAPEDVRPALADAGV